MLKTENKIMIGAALCAVSVWVLDALIDAVFFGEGSFLSQVFFGVTPHEIYFRTLFAACFLLFGFIISRMIVTRSHAEDRFKNHSAAIESSMDGIAIYNGSEVYVYANHAYAFINGYESPEEIIGKSCREMYGDEEYERMQSLLQPSLMKTGKWRGEVVGRRKNGSTYYQEASATLLQDGGRVCIVRDITWRKRSEERMHRSERFLNTIFNSIRDPFCIYDSEFRIIRINDAYAHQKGRSVDELIGMKCYRVLEGRSEVCSGCVVAKTFHSADPCAKDKLVFREGVESWIDIYTYPILDDDGRVSHVIEYIRDATDRKKSEEEKRRMIERLEHLSRTDSLSGLLNRRALSDCLMYEIERARRYGSQLSLILCDMDNFKGINDQYGHDNGDRALQTLAGTLKSMLRKPDIAGRYGGDEFMVILPGTGKAGAEYLAEKILSEIRSIELRFGGKPMRLSMSIGVACLERETDGVDSVIKRADDAMYNSKQAGKDRVSTT